MVATPACCLSTMEGWNMRSQAEKGAAFRALHRRSGCFLIPNPWDPGTAKLLAALGYEALATTSLGVANCIGRADGTVTADEVIANGRAIAAATDLPVNADLENCFAHQPEVAAQTIRRAAEAGLAGGSIEDYSGDDRNPIYEFDLSVERVRAAADVVGRLSVPFVLTARAENLIRGRSDMADTIRRLQAYAEAGAEVLYAPGLRTVAEIRAVVEAVDRPVNVVTGWLEPGLTVADVASAGAKRISVGGALNRLALAAFLDAARAMKHEGSLAWMQQIAPMTEVRAMFQTADDRAG
jgi:2-methylisocitrate lyase-like PEP mutase family enzyme